MIDWVKARVPLDWKEGHPILGGRFLRVSPHGEVERETLLHAHCRGSFDEHVTLRTVERGFVEFDGNPSKFVQGHNIVGSADLCGLVAAAMRKALGILGVDWQAQDEAAWLGGDYGITRVDVTEMFELPTRADVRAWLRASSELGSMRWRGRGQWDRGTQYFGRVESGKRASPWSLKLYCKADELEAKAKGHQLHERLPLREELLAWVDNKLRVELLLRSSELKRYAGGRLTTAKHWNEDTASEIFRQYFAKLELGTNAMLPALEEETLKPALRLAYTSWKAGHDLQAVLSPATFYRYRRQLLTMTGGEVDIRVPQAKSNVVPLKRILEISPAAQPAFLRERPDLLFRRAA